MQIRNREYRADQSFESGSHMFGFSHPKVSRLIKVLTLFQLPVSITLLAFKLMSWYLQEMSHYRSASKSSQLAYKKIKHSSVDDRRVTVGWTDLDKCNVCYMDEVWFFLFLFRFFFSGRSSLNSKSCLKKVYCPFFNYILISLISLSYDGKVNHERRLMYIIFIQEYENNLFLQCDKCRMMVSLYL